ncbi:MAG: DUF4011 domain-containing protein [Planctomycetes bacterium]|nr:DUF4011 domain-containing protein [Planctomycetota bacterium]
MPDAPDPKRRALVERARAGWISRLIDLSRRNNLLYFRSLKVGTLDLALGIARDDLLAGRSVPLTQVRGPVEETRAASIVGEIEDRARTNREERGLETLFVAVGMASWTSSDGGRDPEAPVFLIPIVIEHAGRDRSRVSIRRAGDPQVNLVLLHVLNRELGCNVAAVDLLPEQSDEEVVNLVAAFSRLLGAAQRVTGFRVSERAVLGNFAFQKLAMVRDLQEHAELLVAHDVISALAGDDGARAEIRPSSTAPDVRDFDASAPDEEFLVLDADSSQMQAVVCAQRGEHLVVQGPPGTGKSQTIANLIATCAAQGKSVLFVAEKRAALEAVQKRLCEVGLEHLALDVHGADVSRKKVMERLRVHLDVVRDSTPVSTEPTHSTYVDRRRRLVEHLRRLHSPRPPSQRSVFELQASLVALRDGPQPKARLRGPQIDKLDPATLTAIRDLVRDAGAFEALIHRTDRSPWSSAVLDSGQAVQECVDAARALAWTELPELERSIDRLCAETGRRRPSTIVELEGAIDLQTEIARLLKRHQPVLFDMDLAALACDLAPAGRGAFWRAAARILRARYRSALRDMRGAARTGELAAFDALTDARKASEALERWRAHGPGGTPIPARTEIDEVRLHLESVRAHLTRLDACFPHGPLSSASFAELRERCRALAEHADSAIQIPSFRRIERRLSEHGLGPLLGEIRAAPLPASGWGGFVECCVVASLLDHVRTEDSDVAGFAGAIHGEFVAEFQRLDRECIHLAARRVRRAHAVLAVEAMNRHPEQDKIVRQEVNRTRPRMSMRTLLASAPQVLTKLCPCWMGSPLSVSHLFGAQSRWFDLVVFDEASQVLPEDAIPAILRGSQVVVAGDRHQLPPTTFFADGGNDDDEESVYAPNDAEGFESLLDLMSASSVRSSMLLWHYRSKAEALIAFSNAHIYRHLITFPDTGGEQCIRHVLVADAEPQGVDPDSGSAEVRRVVALVLEHATIRPGETLGVIALGIGHANRVEAAIKRARRDRPELDGFFNRERAERFFVKNLERVQGDERDAIVLSIGLVKDRANVLLNRLGPLNQQGGERRLNVAITRARRRMTLVTSFSHHDMDPSRFHAPGADLLRRYIEYASSGGTIISDRGVTAVAPNPFEADIEQALKLRGINVLPQWGASAYRLDLVACHPTQPSRFVLAIECDGASYHSGYTARERDRLRQQHLEALGWRFCRIWSTDWFNHRDSEINRVVRAYQEAVAYSDRSTADATRSSAETQRGPTTDSTAPLALRGRRPLIYKRQSIAEYADAELIQLALWIRSDGRLRTDEECIEEMVAELGFQRRGARIVERVRRAVEATRP